MRRLALSAAVVVVLVHLVSGQGIAAENAIKEAIGKDFAIAVATEWPTQPQVWTSDNGKFSVKAKLMSVGKHVVVLKKESGEDIEVLISRLSERDRHYVERIRGEAQNRFDALMAGAEEELKEEKQPDILPPAKLQQLLGEIEEIKRQAKLQGNTARNSLFLKEELSKLDKRYGELKVEFPFPVKDVVQREGSYKLTLSGYREAALQNACYLRMDGGGVMFVSGRSGLTVYPDVTKEEMMEIGQGTHHYEVVCGMRASDLSRIVDGYPSPPVNQADCKLVKISNSLDGLTAEAAAKAKKEEVEMAARRARAAALSVQKRRSISARLNARRGANAAGMQQRLQSGVQRGGG